MLQDRGRTYILVVNQLFSVTSGKSCLCLNFLFYKIGKIAIHYLLFAILKFKGLWEPKVGLVCFNFLSLCQTHLVVKSSLNLKLYSHFPDDTNIVEFCRNVQVWLWDTVLNPAGAAYNIYDMNFTPFLKSKQFWILKHLASGVSDKRLYTYETFLIGLYED